MGGHFFLRANKLYSLIELSLAPTKDTIMTLVVGYIHSDLSVHLLCDSAESTEENSSDRMEKSISSFGETVEFEGTKIITESAQKINVINESILFSFAGHVTEGKRSLEDLHIRINLSKGLSTSETIKSYFQETQPRQTEYIIGFQENGIAKLLLYCDQCISVHSSKGDIVFIGRGRQVNSITRPLLWGLNVFSKRNENPANSLVFASALLQTCILNAMSFKDGVGGFINGAFVHNGLVHWASDTCNIVYSSKHFEKGDQFLVKKFNRENVTFVGSVKTGAFAYFPLLSDRPQASNWLKKWFNRLMELDTDCSADYYSFISYDTRIITILKRSNCSFDENLRITKLNEMQSQLSLNDKLVKTLINSDDTEKPVDSYKVQFTWL